MFALYASVAAQTLVLPGEKITLPTAKPEQSVTFPDTAHSSETSSGEKIPSRHIALLLPLKSATYGASADAVRQGFLAAANLDKQPVPVRIYSDIDEDKNVATIYRQAVANGAAAVVGPMTRNGVLALTALKNFPVPTLSLNVIDGAPEQNLYFVGIAVEMEARQIAQAIKQKGVHQAIIVTTRAALSKRLQAAFEDEWSSIGGQILREAEFADDPTLLNDVTEIADTAIFLATDSDKARLLRPYLPNKFPIYATSRVFTGNDNTLVNFDLNDIRFVDMPWLLQADHPAVMSYPRANPPLTIDNERLYALGIDAFRLTTLLMTDDVTRTMPMDGVSGQIQLRGHTFQRIATPATFAQGHAELNDAAAATHRTDFPDANKP